MNLIYDKINGKILFLKKKEGSRLNVSMARNMFPNFEVGVWNVDGFSEDIDVKNTTVILNEDGEPYQLKIFEYGSEIIINGLGERMTPKNDNIIYKGTFFDLGGYANMNRELLFRISKRYNVKTEPVHFARQVDPSTFKKIQSMQKTDFDENGAIKIIGFTPMATSKSNYNIFFTMMEPQTLHPTFADVCNRHADAIITPTRWNKDVFLKGGIDKPIYVCPLGADLNKYNKSVKKSPYKFINVKNGEYTYDLKKFNFITLFGWSHRKGNDVLLKSYLKTFSKNDDVGLLIVSRYNGASSKGAQNHVIKEIKSYMDGGKDNPDIFYCGEEIPINVMPSVMKNGDCFLWTSRGEGFALPLIEAAALGIPTISTFNSAMTDYLTEENSYLVYTDKFVVADQRLTCISPYYEGQKFPLLGEGAVDKFSEHMKYVYGNYSEALSKSEIFYKEVEEKYNWDVAAEKLCEIIEDIKVK